MSGNYTQSFSNIIPYPNKKINKNHRKEIPQCEKNSKYISIPEYCKANDLKLTKFYETLSRHPELAKKLKTNSTGERVLDEKAITAAGAILRKEKKAQLCKSPVSSAADEINILAAKNEVLRKEVSRLKCENERLKADLTGRNEKRRKNIEM